MRNTASASSLAYWGGIREPSGADVGAAIAKRTPDGSDAVADALRRKRRRKRGGTPPRPDASHNTGALPPPRPSAPPEVAPSLPPMQTLSRRALLRVDVLRVVDAKADVLATTLKRRPHHPTAATAAKYTAADNAFRVYVAAAANAEAAVAGATDAYDELAALVARATATVKKAPAAGSGEQCFRPLSTLE